MESGVGSADLMIFRLNNKFIRHKIAPQMLDKPDSCGAVFMLEWKVESGEWSWLRRYKFLSFIINRDLNNRITKWRLYN